MFGMKWNDGYAICQISSDVSGNGFGIDPHLEQYPTSIFQQLS
jgi:hypothetical protein